MLSATWCEELTHWKKLWCWEGLRAGGEGDHRGWDGWMALLTRWMWVWMNSRSWWWTQRPGVLLYSRGRRVGHDWATELNWTENSWYKTEPFQSLSLYLTIAPAYVPAASLSPHHSIRTLPFYFYTTSVHLECPFLLSPQRIPISLQDPV